MLSENVDSVFHGHRIIFINTAHIHTPGTRLSSSKVNGRKEGARICVLQLDYSDNSRVPRGGAVSNSMVAVAEGEVVVKIATSVVEAKGIAVGSGEFQYIVDDGGGSVGLLYPFRGLGAFGEHGGRGGFVEFVSRNAQSLYGLRRLLPA